MRIAVITGASSGLGRELVHAAARHEKFDEIWVIARRAERLEALRESVHAEIRPLALDLSRQSDIESYTTLLAGEKPDVALLVNAAGYAKFGSYAAVPTAESCGMIDLNCRALVQMTEVTLPYMRAGARVIEIASIAAFQPLPYLNVYAATKAFVLSYSRALNREVRPRGITVTAVCPGWMKTEFFARAEQTGKVIRYYDCFHDVRAVAQKALHDASRGRDMSVHGLRTATESLLIKLLPHSAVMSMWQAQQHLPCKKNSARREGD